MSKREREIDDDERRFPKKYATRLQLALQNKEKENLPYAHWTIKPNFSKKMPRHGQYKRRSRRQPSYERMAARIAAGGQRVYWDKVDRAWLPRETPQTRKLFALSPRYATEDQMGLRIKHGYKGRGDYMSAMRGAYAAASALPWQRIGRTGLAAFRAGRKAWTGSGDYQGPAMAEPSSVSTYGPAVDNQLIAGGNPPISVNSGNDLTGDITFANTEFVQNINVDADPAKFHNLTLGINPGLADTFPFLSQLAKNFTLYKFEGLIFEFRPTSGEFGSASNALGKVIMATNYDPNDDPFAMARTMENYDYATSSKPSLTVRHGVETASSQSPLTMNYVRVNDAQQRDKIFSDLGTFQLATEGLPAVGIIGELWVTYKVTLSRSKINTSGNGQYISSSEKPILAVTSNVNPFSGVNEIPGTDNIGITLSGNTVTFPTSSKGKAYRIAFRIRYLYTAPLNQPVPTFTHPGGSAAVVVGTTGTLLDNYSSVIETTTVSGTQFYTCEKGVWFNTNDTPEVTLTFAASTFNGGAVERTFLFVDEISVAVAKSMV